MMPDAGPQVPVRIRWMIRRDMPEVLRIENASAAPPPARPWTEDDFLYCLRQHNCIGMVAEYGDQVVGIMLYALHADRLELLNFAVDPTFRRNGIGSHMMQRLVTMLLRASISLEVRESNLAGQLFLRAAGFRATRIKRGRYDDTGEDGYLMEYHLASSTADAGCGQAESV